MTMTTCAVVLEALFSTRAKLWVLFHRELVQQHI